MARVEIYDDGYFRVIHKGKVVLKTVYRSKAEQLKTIINLLGYGRK